MSQIVVRGVDESLWRLFRTVAVMTGKTSGDLLNEVIDAWSKRIVIERFECENADGSRVLVHEVVRTLREQREAGT